MFFFFIAIELNSHKKTANINLIMQLLCHIKLADFLVHMNADSPLIGTYFLYEEAGSYYCSLLCMLVNNESLHI